MAFTTPILYKESILIYDIDFVREGDPEGTKYEMVVHSTTDGDFIMSRRVKISPKDEVFSNLDSGISVFKIEDVSSVSNSPIKGSEDYISN
jgi:hypothetical protein